jgi:hypothetical protein
MTGAPAGLGPVLGTSAVGVGPVGLLRVPAKNSVAGGTPGVARQVGYLLSRIHGRGSPAGLSGRAKRGLDLSLGLFCAYSAAAEVESPRESCMTPGAVIQPNAYGGLNGQDYRWAFIPGQSF